SAHAAPLLCLAPAAIFRRPARRAGTAGPREHQHDADLYSFGLSAPGEDLRPSAPTRPQKVRDFGYDITAAMRPLVCAATCCACCQHLAKIYDQAHPRARKK